MPVVGVLEVGLDERRADVGGRGVGHQRPDPGPGPVGAHQQLGGHGHPVGEDQLVTAVAARGDGGDLAPPPNRPVGQRVEQDATQIAAQHLRSPVRAVVGLVEEHGPVSVEHAGRLAAAVDHRLELVGQLGRGERDLAVFGVDVELPTLPAAAR
jgi:hypothetical protein